MQQILAEHIARLEAKIIELKRELRSENLVGSERSEREIALANAEEGLRLLRKSSDLEHGFSE